MAKRPVILVTGAGKGIGRAIAVEFSKWVECDLFLTSRTESDLVSLKKDCESWKATAHFLAADLSTKDAADQIMDACIDRFKHIDVIINNAGVGRFGDFSELTEDDYEFTMNTNLRGLFFLNQRAYQEMAKTKAGHLFFITSVAAVKPFEQSALYCMSKYAQKGFLEVLRLYARPNQIRVTNIMPGAVETPMWGEVTPEMQARMMKPEDIAAAVVQAYLQPTRTTVEEIVLRPVGGDL